MPITLEQAAEILNVNNHRGWDTWFVMAGEIFGDGHDLTFFEAVAIAEKYEREEPAPAEPQLTKIQWAARSLIEKLAPHRDHNHWVQSIGTGGGRIVVYLRKNPWQGRDIIPREYEGFSVETIFCGEVRVGPPED